MLCDSSGCHSSLYSSSSSTSVESSRYPFPLPAPCAAPTATGHVPAAFHTLGSPNRIWESFPTTPMFAATPTLCSTCSLHAPVQQPFNSPTERRWLDRNLRQLTLAYLGSIATRPMWHHVSSASACKGVVNVKNILQIEIQQQSCLWLERAVRRAPSCLLAHLCLSKSWGQPAWFRVPWHPPGPGLEKLLEDGLVWLNVLLCVSSGKIIFSHIVIQKS